VWLDLHGGSTLEELAPCVFAYETKNSLTNVRLKSILSAISVEYPVLCPPGTWLKADTIENKIAYLIFESGDRGRREKVNINQQLLWVRQTLADLNMLDNFKNVHKKQMHAYHRLQSVFAPKFGLWMPQVRAGQMVKKGDVIATLCHCRDISSCHCDSPWMEKQSLIVSPISGVLLWQTVKSIANRGDEMAAVAGEYKSLKLK
jgi:predicted deacylase